MCGEWDQQFKRASRVNASFGRRRLFITKHVLFLKLIRFLFCSANRSVRSVFLNSKRSVVPDFAVSLLNRLVMSRAIWVRFCYRIASNSRFKVKRLFDCLVCWERVLCALVRGQQTRFGLAFLNCFPDRFPIRLPTSVPLRASATRPRSCPLAFGLVYCLVYLLAFIVYYLVHCLGQLFVDNQPLSIVWTAVLISKCVF